MTTLEEKKKIILNFEGPVAAVVTPFDNEGKLDTTQILPYAKHLIKIGIKGVFISGTTGEGFLLSVNERLSLIQAWRQALDQLKDTQQLLAIVNVSSTVVGDVESLASKVESLGFDGVALLPPIYYTVSTREQLVGYLKPILQKAAPETPFLYYHIPSLSGELKFELDSFVDLALQKIPQFVAMKFSDNNLVRFGAVQEQFGKRIKVFPGFNEILLPTKAFGIKAVICATFSFEDCVSWYLSMGKSYESGDLEGAVKFQKAIADKCVQLRKSGSFITSIKSGLNIDLKKDGISLGQPRAPVYVPEN